jgi:hypothetical protein
MKRLVGALTAAVFMAFLAGLAGEILLYFLPAGTFHDALAFGLPMRFSPSTLNLGICTLTFGFSLHVTPLMILGLVAGIFIYRKFA